MSKMKKAALAYAKRDWPIFPVRVNKKPYNEHGVIEATTDVEQIEEWWDEWPAANIAVNCGAAGLLVLDYDPGHDLGELHENVGNLPKTPLSASTPRGGFHSYFALDEGEYIPASASKLADHIDVRSFNSYVLLPPSRTSDGTYEWDGDGTEKPAYRTDKLAELALAAKPDRSEDSNTWIIEPDLEVNQEAAIKWLTEKAQIAIDCRGGDHCAYATGAMMKSFGMSEATAMELMWDYWNPRCVPPWRPDEMDHFERKIINGYSYNTSPPGNVTAGYEVARKANLFSKVEKIALPGKGTELTLNGYRIVDRDGMDHIRPPEWLIPNFLPASSYSIIFGKFGTFKTFVALDIGLSIAHGGGGLPWDGPRRLWPQVKNTGPVLFCAGEGRSSLTARVLAWEQYHAGGKRSEDFLLMDPVPSISRDLEDFINIARQLRPDGYSAVFIDTIGRAMQGQNENSQEAASSFTELVQRLQYELGNPAIVGLHHVGHSEEKRARGSSVFGADADMMVRLDREGKDKMITMTMTKQKGASEWENSIKIMAEVLTVEWNGPKETLIVRASKRDEIKKRTKENSKDKLEGAMTAELIDRIADEILKENEHLAYSQKDLAQSVAGDSRVGVKSRMIGNYLQDLRETNGTRAILHYDKDGPRKTWRYEQMVGR